jgi:hypothetical protein
MTNRLRSQVAVDDLNVLSLVRLRTMAEESAAHEATVE